MRPFKDIADLHRGDPIQVTTGQGVFDYRVEDVRGQGDPQPPALTADQARLLLVTTDSSTLGAMSTVYVDALLTSPAAVTPPRAALYCPPSENEMASDPSAYLPLVLWLFALVGVAAFAAWGSSAGARPRPGSSPSPSSSSSSGAPPTTQPCCCPT